MRSNTPIEELQVYWHNTLRHMIKDHMYEKPPASASNIIVVLKSPIKGKLKEDNNIGPYTAELDYASPDWSKAQKTLASWRSIKRDSISIVTLIVMFTLVGAPKVVDKRESSASSKQREEAPAILQNERARDNLASDVMSRWHGKPNCPINNA
ncbi:hypothetical protein LTR66_004284 [Elasticomyces elasticus]|nr:hypothetical protein LTR66_004284 [Elasticomyces elasticus]